MADSPIDAPGSNPIGPLVAEWSEVESARADELERLLNPIEQSLEQLTQWADQLAQEQSAAAAAREEAARREAAGEERRRLLERDLKLARTRVGELERTVPDRTEELLRAQTANNALAAELQAIGDDLAGDDNYDEGPRNAEPGEIDGALALAAEEGNEAASGENSDSSHGVAERFARLRRTG